MAVVAHCPAPGVNVYVVVVVLLTIAGLQVPVTPLVDVAGSTGAVDPLQIGPTGAKVGVIPGGVTVTVNEAVVAHCPAFGVKVYDVVVVLLTVAGLHVPEIPLIEVAGSTGAVDPLQIDATGLNVGTTVVTVKLRQPGSATFPQRSVTDPEAAVRQTW